MDNKTSNTTDINPFRGEAAPIVSKPRTSPKPKENININPIHVIVFLSIAAVIILLIITLVEIFHKNPYGSQIKIDNIDKYYSSMPRDTKDAIYNTLYNIVSNNVDSEESIPKSGAVIRSNSATSNHDNITNIYTDKFIIDIESLQQSYDAIITWSPVPNNPNLITGYPVLITCPKPDQLIYPSFNCSDQFTINGIYNDPVFAVLPMNIAYYKNNYSEYTSYSIRAEVRDKEKIVIFIDDNTGGNRQAALSKLREAGINPDDYTVEYNDLSSDQIPSRAPSN